MTNRTLQLGALATDMIRLKLGRTPEGTDQGRRRLMERMGALHALPQKIGQILSLSELGSETGIYTPLTEAGPGLEPARALRVIEQSLGRSLESCFASIEPQGIGASIGQVHRAVLHDGQPVAVKFQYPDIARHLETDLKALGWMTAPVGGLRRGFDVKEYQGEVGRMLESELDYRREAQALRNFRHFTSGWETLEIPTVIDALSNDRVLTMSWLEGEPFEATRAWSDNRKTVAAETLLRFFLTGALRWGYLHADPHPGNFRFRLDQGKVRVGVLDFGCVKKLDRDVVLALARLLEDAVAGRLAHCPDRALARYAALGFKPDAMEPLADRLPDLSRVLFEPFLENRPYDPAGWRLGERTEQILGELRWNFRMAGPAHLVYFMRAYQGVTRYLSALGVAVNWRAVLEETLRPAQPDADAEDVPQLRRQARPRTRSESLRIAVTEKRQPKVALTFRAHCAEHLPELLPPDVAEKLEARGIDAAAIARHAAACGFEPMELFELKEGAKEIRVWLE